MLEVFKGEIEEEEQSEEQGQKQESEEGFLKGTSVAIEEDTEATAVRDKATLFRQAICA